MQLKKFELLFDFLFNILIIFLGIELVNFFGNYSMPLKAVGLIGFAAVAFGFFRALPQLLLLVVSVYILIFKKVNPEEVSNKVLKSIKQSDEEVSEVEVVDMLPSIDNSKDRFVKISSKVLGFSLLIGWLWMLFEMKPCDNTIHGTQLFWRTTGIGALVGLAIGLIAIQSSKQIKTNIALGLNFFVVTPLIFATLFFDAANCINCNFTSETKVQSFTVISKGINSSKGNRYVHIKTETGEERLEVSRKFFDAVEEHKPLQLQLEKGYFGYWVVKF